MATLKDSFLAFCAYGQTNKSVADMDNKNFLKCLKDSGIVDKKFTSTDVDLIFSQVKDKGGRRISFEQFKTALGKVATKKGTDQASIEALVAAAKPVTNATQADFVKFHDDKSTYTGVYAAGGPTNVDKDKQGLAAHLDRSDADVRGVKKSLA